MTFKTVVSSKKSSYSFKMANSSDGTKILTLVDSVINIKLAIVESVSGCRIIWLVGTARESIPIYLDLHQVHNIMSGCNLCAT